MQASSLQRWKRWLFFTLGQNPKIHPNQLLWLRWQLGKHWWCPIPMMCVKPGAPSHPGMQKAGWMQLFFNIIFSPRTSKQPEDWGIASIKSFSDVRLPLTLWVGGGKLTGLPFSQPQPKGIHTGISRYQFAVHRGDEHPTLHRCTTAAVGVCSR